MSLHDARFHPCLLSAIMPPLRQMQPHAQRYLRRLILDEGLPEPMKDWVPLPWGWKELDYSGTIPDSQIVGYDSLVTETTFNRYALASESSSRRFVADGCIDSRCPFFYFEVKIQAEVPLNAK